MQTSSTGKSRLHSQSIEQKEVLDALIRLLSDAIDHTQRKPAFICQTSNRHYSRKAANVGGQS